MFSPKRLPHLCLSSVGISVLIVIILCELEDHEFDYQDPWSQILANCAWAIRYTVHSVLNATPAQIVFGRDMLFDLYSTTEYKEIRKRKQETSDAKQLVSL
jgi:hypothetical protein